VSSPPPDSQDELPPIRNRYKAADVMNLDETPLPFEWLDGKTYELKGAKTVNMKTEREGWTKRQATLILYIFADGIPRIRPKLIFHGTPTNKGGKIEGNESKDYHPGVTFHFNQTAYNNEDLTEEWLDNELLPLIQPTARPFLLCLDCASFHKTPPLLAKMKKSNILPALIPPGCTGLLQPLDTHINKPFKEYLREENDKYLEGKRGIINSWTVSDKRIMATHIVGDAWERFCIEKKGVIEKSFQDLGIFIAADGSQDDLISIKGFEKSELIIGNYYQRDPQFEHYQEMPSDDIDEFVIDNM